MKLENWKWIFAAVFLMINTVWDLKKREVLLWSVLLFAAIGIAIALCGEKQEIKSCFWGIFPGIAVMGAAALSRGAVGYGDGMAISVCGIYMGFVKTFAMLFYALSACSAVSVVLIAAGRRTCKTKVAFLPYLLLGHFCLLLF